MLGNFLKCQCIFRLSSLYKQIGKGKVQYFLSLFADHLPAKHSLVSTSTSLAPSGAPKISLKPIYQLHSSVRNIQSKAVLNLAPTNNALNYSYATFTINESRKSSSIYLVYLFVIWFRVTIVPIFHAFSVTQTTLHTAGDFNVVRSSVDATGKSYGQRSQVEITIDKVAVVDLGSSGCSWSRWNQLLGGGAVSASRLPGNGSGSVD